MNILWVEDDWGLALHLFEQVSNIHNIIQSTNIVDAHDKLTQSFSGKLANIDMVLIDLDLNIGTTRNPLDAWFSPHLGDQDSINQGQALGQWLWEAEGARAKPNLERPTHCYVTAVSDIYRRHKDKTKQEFDDFDIARRHFLIDKWAGGNLATDIIKIDDLWKSNGWK